MQDYELKLSQFIDNELPIDEQQEFFYFLSQNEEARNTLAEYIEMKKGAKALYTSLEVQLNDPNFTNLYAGKPEKNNKKYKFMFYFSAAASIIFAFLFLFNEFSPNPILKKYQNLQSEMIELREHYNAELNKQTELTKINDQLYEETDKLKTAEVKKNKSDNKIPNVQLPKKNNQQKKTNFDSVNDYLANVPTFVVTKDDFLGQQIIGN